MFKKFLLAIGGFVLVVLMLGAVKSAQISEMSAMVFTPPPTAVTTAEARVENWNPRLRAIGTLVPVQGVTVSADADGSIVRIAVENGAAVKAGDLLVELDTSVEQAQLGSAKARAALAQIERNRSAELREKNTVSQAELDAAKAQYDQAAAEVAAIEATIERKKVRAPFAGRVGIRSVNVGQYVGRGQALMPLQQLDPIYVNFSVPQRELPFIALGHAIAVNIDAFPGVEFDGRLTAINAEVDAATRNISAQATLSNPLEQLRPGMFAQVEVTLPQSERVVVVPSTAVSYASYGNSVFVVETMKNEDGSEYLGVRQQPVRLGVTRGDLIVIAEGLAGGEQVASSGLFKLRNGMNVQVNNTVQPSSSANPKPKNS
jgi:membrane fusion protein (multidrug efflux system)